MIDELRITNLGVIEESVLELGPGLSVITGETGAGKTMLVTALGLLLGGRADSGAVRSGARSARVEGRFGVDARLVQRIDKVGGEVEDGVLLARQVHAEGRSRAFVGGAAVPVSVLAELGEELVAVHGQSDQHRLLRPEAQRACLDAFAGESVWTVLSDYESTFDELVRVERELRGVIESSRERAREVELLRHGVEEIEAVAPLAGEDMELAAEEERLGHADTLRTAAGQAQEVLSSAEGSPDALTAVGVARKLLEDVRDHDSQAAALGDRLAEVSYLLSDLAADVSSYVSSLESDPQRLAAVSERRAALGSLTRRYGETVADVLAWAAHASERLLDLDGAEEKAGELRGRVAHLREVLADLGIRLSHARSSAALTLGERVTTEVHALAMPHAQVSLAVRQLETAHDRPGLDLPNGRRVRFARHGIDEIELRLAANSGSEPRPLSKSASGGELSRVMLGLEVTLAGTGSTPTFVFDEVDAGVGGKAAVEIGRRLAALARSAQVVVVTHLPQVAAFADRHVVVRKSNHGLVTTSDLTVLPEKDRVRELSRMLAGMEASETAMAHAKELLASARAAR